jgi:hypothetical protein
LIACDQILTFHVQVLISHLADIEAKLASIPVRRISALHYARSASSPPFSNSHTVANRRPLPLSSLALKPSLPNQHSIMLHRWHYPMRPQTTLNQSSPRRWSLTAPMPMLSLSSKARAQWLSHWLLRGTADIDALQQSLLPPLPPPPHLQQQQHRRIDQKRTLMRVQFCLFQNSSPALAASKIRPKIVQMRQKQMQFSAQASVRRSSFQTPRSTAFFLQAAVLRVLLLVL